VKNANRSRYWPDLASLYPRWTRVEIVVNKAMSHGGKRGSNATKATEVLLINGPSYTQAEDMPLMAQAEKQ